MILFKLQQPFMGISDLRSYKLHIHLFSDIRPYNAKWLVHTFRIGENANHCCYERWLHSRVWIMLVSLHPPSHYDHSSLSADCLPYMIADSRPMWGRLYILYNSHKSLFSSLSLPGVMTAWLGLACMPPPPPPPLSAACTPPRIPGWRWLPG